ncbi:MAG: chitobiase/beta-hexosaminidase C-terminal domain-containing protein [Lachnospiraceae bacterium]|nr:chitobiase/beta-hexosaminidase C-terminal domain-containing protein [Lachnospiraceae bacterium]
MKKNVYVAFLMTIVCLAIAMVPLTAALGEPEGNPEFIIFDPADYELSVLPGTYDNALVLTVKSMISDNANIITDAKSGLEENNLIKGILLSGNSITTQEQLKNYIQSASLLAAYEDDQFNVSISDPNIGISKEDAKRVLKDVYLLMYGMEVDDDSLDTYVETWMGTSAAQREKFRMISEIVADRAIWFESMIKTLYEEGPVVSDNYIYYGFRNLYGPDIDIPQKTVTYYLEQYEEPTDYYLFILNKKTTNLKGKLNTGNPIENDEYSVYHYRIRGKKDKAVSLPSNTADQEYIYTEDLLVELFEDGKQPTQRVYYTTDGTDPAVSEGRKEYTGGGIKLEGIPGRKTTVTLKVYYEASEYQASDYLEYTYIIEKEKEQAEKPKTSIPANYYTDDRVITLDTSNTYENTKTWYTLDGSDPLTSPSRKEYDGKGIEISGIPGEVTRVVLKAYSVGEENYSAGETAEYVYYINKPKEKAATPVADVNGGSYTEDKQVKLSVAEGVYEPLKIYYTLDGSDPAVSESRKLYKDAIDISGVPGVKNSIVLKACAEGVKNYSVSDTAEYRYEITKAKLTAPEVTADLKEGSYIKDIAVKLSCAKGAYEDLNIYYTLDGSDPSVSANAVKYDGGEIKISGEAGKKTETVLKACAVGDKNYSTGKISEIHYTIDKEWLKLEPFSIKTGNKDNAVTTEFDVIVTKTISYNGTTHVIEGAEEDENKTADIHAEIKGAVTEYATPVFNAKKSKNVSKDGAYLTLSFKAKSNATAEQKALIKQLNKKLKNKKIRIEFNARELTKDNIRLETLKKNKYKVIYITDDGSEIKLKSKDYKLKKKKGIITVSGKGNYTGKVEFK